jgi:FeS assembly protein IscX
VLLTWDDGYEIVQQLRESYPDRDVEDIGMDELFQMIVGLPSFGDDPALVNEGILKDILREWYEESSH